MSSTTFALIGVSYYIIALIIIIVVLNIINKKEKKKYQEKISLLERDKNLIIGANILSELNKVEGLINNETMKKVFASWQERFANIKDEDLPLITDDIEEVVELFNQKKYKELSQKIAKLEYKIYYVKTKSDYLLNEIKEITLSEDRNREIITKLKTKYRAIVTKYNNHKDEYADISSSIELQFENVDKLFSAFEKTIEDNNYPELSRIVKALEDLIGNLELVVNESPSIVMMSEKLIPAKIKDLLETADKMQKQGYNLDYLNLEYNFKETNKKVEDILSRLKVLNIIDSTFDLKTIVKYLDDLYTEFDKEKLSKKKYEDYVGSILVKVNKYEKVETTEPKVTVVEPIKKVKDFKYSYDLTDEDVKVIYVIKNELKEIKDDYQRVVDAFRTKTFAYSRLVKEMKVVNARLKQCGEKIDYALKTLGSLKEDETRAREQLKEIKDILNKAKIKIDSYKMPSIPDKYYVELKEANQSIKDLVDELNKQPISIKTLNVRVDTARDLVLKLFNTANESVKSAYMAEMSIVYGNRYRSINENINSGLDRAETLFLKGEFKESLESSINAINIIEPNYYEVLKETLK